MKAVSDALGVARSNLAERRTRLARPRGPYRKPEDAALLPTIREIVDARPTYGYRRITALVNRIRRARSEPTINSKRVLRIMRVNGLTLAPHTALRPGRTHDGVVVALRSNVRWCSDHLELHPRDGSVVRVLFAIDACDREVIAWSATHGRRLGRDGARPDGGLRRAPVWINTDEAPRRVAVGQRQRLHCQADGADRHRAWLAPRLHARALAGEQRRLGGVREDLEARLRPRHPAARRRDRAAASAGWIEDYNTVHPHSGLRFLSPREFLALSA